MMKKMTNFMMLYPLNNIIIDDTAIVIQEWIKEGWCWHLS